MACAEMRFSISRRGQIDGAPKCGRSDRLRRRIEFRFQNRAAMFPELILVPGKCHVSAVAYDLNEFHLGKMGVQKRQQVNTARLLPSPKLRRIGDPAAV